MNNKDRIRKLFNRSADSYDQAATAQQHILKSLLAQPLPKQPKVILDLGCGTGNAIPILRQRYPNATIISCDIAENMLKTAQRKYNDNQITWLCADMESLPIAGHQVDLIISNLAIQWSQSFSTLVYQCQRILKPTGAFYFATLSPDTLPELQYATKRGLNQYYPPSALQKILKQQHFTNIILQNQTHIEYFLTCRDVLHNLKQLGAQHHPKRPRHLARKRDLDTLFNRYQQFCLPDGRIPMTYRVIIGRASVL